MKKNFIQANRQMASKSKRPQQAAQKNPLKNQPVSLPDKIKNIEKKLEKLEDNAIQSKILQEMKIIKAELRQIKSNMNYSKSNHKNYGNEEDVSQSVVVRTNKSKSVERSDSPTLEQNSHQSIKIKDSKVRKVVTVAKEIIPPSILQAYLKDYKIEGTKPAPYYMAYVKKNSAPLFVKYGSKSLQRESEVYRRLWKDIVKARWICINKLYQNNEAQIDLLIIDRNPAPINGLPARRILVDILKILEFIHNSGYLYRNIAPQHFMLNSEGKLVVVDFKNAKKYVDAKGNHLQISQSHYNCGDFGSTAQLRLIEEGRKDDLESLGYMALHLLVGEVAWAGMEREEMMKCRNGLTLQQLYKPIPEWLDYMKYVHKLNRIQKPDYTKLIEMIGEEE